MSKLVERKFGAYTSCDELDLGEALWLCSWYPQEVWCSTVAKECLECVESLFQGRRLERPPSTRLMFREMGLTIGVQCAVDIRVHPEWDQRVKRLHRFWEDKLYDRDHDISSLMFVASILPHTFKPPRGFIVG
jgi:hypothetical protein